MLPTKRIESIAKGETPQIATGQIYLRSDSIYRITQVDAENSRFEYDEYDYIQGKFRKGYQSFSIDNFFRYPVILIQSESAIADYIEQAIGVINGTVDLSDKDANDIDESTALVSRNAKQSLSAMSDSLEQRKNHVELVRVMVGKEMEKRKAELDKIRSQLSVIMDGYKRNMEKIQRIITSIELYLGIGEELHQIKIGKLAPSDTPISFRQQVLFMDEEVGKWQDGGLDWTDVEWFDEWLLENDNYKDLIPEEKGMVAFRPRRYDKEYGSSAQNAANNEANRRMSYLLCRNGENIYRIYTDKLVIYPRLFPLRKDLAALQEAMDNEKEDFKLNPSDWSTVKVDDFIHQYRKQSLLMQGLIQRTDIFTPLPSETISLFAPETLDGYVSFIYDDEMLLPTGKQTFRDWKSDINQKIEKGSRVLIVGNMCDRDMANRNGYIYYANEYRYPSPPQTGVYTVEEFMPTATTKLFADGDGDSDKFIEGHPEAKIIETYTSRGGRKVNIVKYNTQKETDLIIKYNPKGEVYSGWGDYEGHERKNRISVRIHKDAGYILNYDQISLEDVEFYLTSRIDRPNYLGMMPVLQMVKEHKLKEQAQEMEFVKLVLGRNPKATEPQVLELIEWWKLKNQWKRSIEKDDAKALRMIEAKLKNNKL